MSESKGNMLSDLTVKDYLEKSGSDSPVPGGGCAAALCGALSAALGEMVTNLTIGRDKYGDSEADMTNYRDKLRLYKDKLMLDINRDARAYEKVMFAYKIPKDAEHEDIRKSEIQVALKEASLAPLEVANNAIQLLILIEKVVKLGNKNAVTDGLVAALLARSAALSAILNVRVNLESISDMAFKEQVEQDVDELEKKSIQKENDILTWYKSA